MILINIHFSDTFFKDNKLLLISFASLASFGILLIVPSDYSLPAKSIITSDPPIYLLFESLKLIIYWSNFNLSSSILSVKYFIILLTSSYLGYLLYQLE